MPRTCFVMIFGERQRTEGSAPESTELNPVRRKLDQPRSADSTSFGSACQLIIIVHSESPPSLTSCANFRRYLPCSEISSIALKRPIRLGNRIHRLHESGKFYRSIRLLLGSRKSLIRSCYGVVWLGPEMCCSVNALR